MSRTPLLPANWDVPEVFRDRLGEEVGRQRAMIADGQLLLVLHAAPTGDEAERIGRLFWHDGAGNWIATSGKNGRAALDAHLAEFEARVETLNRRETAAQTSSDYFELVQEAAPLQRAIRHLYEALQSAREALPKVRDLIDLRDDAYRLDRAAELVTSDCRHGLDYLIAKSAQEQAASSDRMAVSAHRLNLLVGMFFPVATLATVFGVNIRHGFEDIEPPWPFLAFVGSGLLLGVLLMIFITRSGDRARD